MSFLRKLFGREEPEDVAVSLDVDRRKEQLLRLERGSRRARLRDACAITPWTIPHGANGSTSTAGWLARR